MMLTSVYSLKKMLASVYIIFFRIKKSVYIIFLFKKMLASIYVGKCLYTCRCICPEREIYFFIL